MSEKEKMLAGELYDTNYDRELIKDIYKAKDICYEYNNLKPSDFEGKDKIIKELFAKTGKQIIVEQNFWCDYGYNIFVGENFYMNHNCIILDGAKVEFGDNVFIAPNCGFYTVGHPLDYKIRNKEYPTLKLAKTNKFHDRFIIIDEIELYHCGASIKDLGKKCFAISKVENKEMLEMLKSII